MANSIQTLQINKAHCIHYEQSLEASRFKMLSIKMVIIQQIKKENDEH